MPCPPNISVNNIGGKLYLPGRDYYDESLTKHQTILNNLEQGASLSNDNSDHHRGIYLQDDREKNIFYQNLPRFHTVPFISMSEKKILHISYLLSNKI